MAEIKNKYNSSFSILRANPKISGNVKITIDSSQNLWLNSIDSNDQISKSKYKGFKISSNSDYSQDLYKFFDKGRTPEEFVFGIKNQDSPVETFVSHFEDQYDGFYSAGASTLISDIYKENFSYFSPFWLGKKIPGHFVIYRIDDPIDFSYINPVTSLEIGKSYKVVDSSNSGYSIISSNINYQSGSIFVATSNDFSTVSGEGNIISLDPNYNYDLLNDPINHFQNKILPKTSIVTSYDLSENSEIGKYLRKIQNSVNYKETLADIRFEENLMSYYHGVNYSNGVYDIKGEYLYDFYTNPTTQIEFDEFITDGFSRNGIISYKYLNLEFLFDDTEAPLYSINRYFGVFVDEIPTGSFRLKGSEFFNKSYISGNTPEPKTPTYVSDTMESSFYQENESGIRLFIDPSTKWGYIPSSDIVNNNNRFYYIKDNSGSFYSYKRILNYSNNSDGKFKWGTNDNNKNEIVLSNKLVDLSKFTGFNISTIKQYDGSIAKIKGNPYCLINIGGTFNIGEAIIIYHPLGRKTIDGKKCDIILASDMSTVVEDWGPGSFYNLGESIYFHPFGTKNEIAKSIFNAINSIVYKGFDAFLFDSEIIIRTYGSGFAYNFSFSVDCMSNPSNNTRMERPGIFSVNGIDALDFRRDQFFIGGTDHIKNRVKISISDSYKIVPGKSLIRTANGVSIINNIFAYVDDVQKTSRSSTLNGYKTHAIITCEDYIDPVKIGYLGKIIVEEIYDNESGVFSVYPIKDLDYDFWSSEYSKNPSDEYYRYLDLQPNGISKIEKGQTYCVNSGCIVLYDGNYYGDVETSPAIKFFIGGDSNSFQVIKQSPDARFVLIPLAFTKNPSEIIFDQSTPEPLTDLDNFSGFSSIQDIKYIDDLDSIITKKDQMKFGKLNTEYELLKENYIKNFVTKSRVTPYISKWVYNGGTDVRGNEYRLNVHHAFSPFNFSPSFFSAGRDPRYFTHEWYLLETPRKDSPDSLVKNSLSYCSSILDLEKLKNTNPSSSDYFTEYFSIDGKDFNDNFNLFLTSESNPISEKYTVFEYNEASGYSETLFRGVKIRIKGRTDSSIQTNTKGEFKTNDRTYDGYKFSCLIRPIEDSDPYTPTAPITYKIYENKSFKTITFVISIINNDSRFVDGSKYWNKISSSPGEEGNSWEFNPTGIYGGLDYMSLYTISDKLMLYPISYEPNYISVISDIKLSSSLNFSFNPGSLGIEPKLNSGSINGSGIIPIIRNNEYNTDLRDEINSYYLPSTPITGSGSPYDLTSSPPLTINGSNENGLFTFYSPIEGTNDNWYTLPWPVGAGKNEIYFNQTDPIASSGTYIPNFSNLGYPPPIFSVAPINVNYNNIAIKAAYQKEGGSDYWKKLLEKISFADISLLLNSEDPYIKYYSYNWDDINLQTLETTESFVIDAVRPSAFTQSINLYPIEDLEKPQSLAKNVVGYNLAGQNYTTEFYRYGGGYNPKFRDIIHFSSNKDDILEDEILHFSVSLSEKNSDSLYPYIGSNYDILMNGESRKEIRLTRGVQYQFDFSNFYALGFGPSPNTEIQEELVITKVENDGGIQYLFTNGVLLNNSGNLLIFNVPYDAPDILYYELKGKKYSGGKIYIEENLNFKNCKLGVEKDNFGIMKNISYNKYAISNPFTIDPNSGFKPVYPLINECPFDIRDMSIFESTWDPGRYRNYLSKNTYELLPGTRSMIEEKNYFGSKIMKTPDIVNLQKQNLYQDQIPNVFSMNTTLYSGYDVFYEETSNQIMCVLLVDRSLVNYFDESGAGNTFNKLLLPEFGTGDRTSLSDDINNYLLLNVVPTFKADNIVVYIKKIKKESNTILKSPTIITNLSDHDKIKNGFYVIDQIKVLEINHLQYEFTFGKDPGYDYELAFSYNLSKI